VLGFVLARLLWRRGGMFAIDFFCTKKCPFRLAVLYAGGNQGSSRGRVFHRIFTFAVFESLE
jgi:hypothetical protein